MKSLTIVSTALSASNVQMTYQTQKFWEQIIDQKMSAVVRHQPTEQEHNMSNSFIPDVVLTKTENISITKRVWFTWRGKAQWLEMSKDNAYNDGYWLITATEYSEDFEAWLDENLDDYDSLESMFDEQEQN